MRKPVLFRLSAGLLLFYVTACSQQAAKPVALEDAQKKFYQQHAQQLPNTQPTPIENHQDVESSVLTPQLSVSLFLQHSPRVQQAITQFKLIDTEKSQSLQTHNPSLNFDLLKASAGGGWLWDISLMQPLFDWISKGDKKKFADSEASLQEMDILIQLNEWVSNTESYYFSAVYAQQKLNLAKLELQSSDAEQSLAKALFVAGNISEKDYLKYLDSFQSKQLEYTEAESLLAEAKLNLDHWIGDSHYTLPDVLPEPINLSLSQASFVQVATKNNLELQKMSVALAQISNQLALNRREVSALNMTVGPAAKKDSETSSSKGIAVEMPLAIFDQGQAKKTALLLHQEEIETRQRLITQKIVLDFNSSLINLNRVNAKIKILLEQGETLKKIQDKLQKEVNYMLASPFDLIEVRYALLAVEQKINAEKLEFWRSYSQLEWQLGEPLLDYSQSQSEVVTKVPTQDHSNHAH